MATDSTRFLVQMIMNLVLGKYAKKKIAKIATKKHGRQAFKSYLIFLMFAICLIGLNQAVFFFFKPRNLYQQLQIPRSLSPQKIKSYEDDLKIKLMQQESIPMNIRIENLKRLEAMVQVLTHPARRLSYDTFGETDTGYAWAFKSHNYLLSTVIGASIFYIMCTFLNMISDKKGEIKEVFKLEIMVMILLFLWEVQLIMKTENRFHQHTDSLDMLYTSFPMFQRRQMIKIILLPCMNIIKFFYRFYIRTGSEKKFLQISKNQYLLRTTQQVSESVHKVKLDEHFDDGVKLAIESFKKQKQIKAEIFRTQRNVLQSLVEVQGDNIFIDEETLPILRHFMIKIKMQ